MPTTEYVVKIDSTQAVRGGNEVASAFDKTSKSASSLSQWISSVKGELDDFKTGFVAALSLGGLQAGITSVVSKNMEFTKSLAALSSITGAVGADLDYLSNTALANAGTAMLNAFKVVGSQKPELLSMKEALVDTTMSAKLLADAAKESDFTLEKSAIALTGQLNQFKAGADQADRFVNVLAAGAKAGAASILEVADSMRESGSVANSMGISFEKSNAVIQTLSLNVIKGGTAGIAFRNILLALAKQSDNEINPKIVGLTTAFENLRAKNLSTTEMIKLFSTENVNAATALLSNIEKIKEMELAVTGTKVAYEQASINNDTLANDVDELGEAFDVFQIKLGAEVAPTIRVVAQSLTELLRGSDALIASVVPLSKIVAGGLGLLAVPTLVTTATTAVGGFALALSKLPLLAALPTKAIVGLLDGVAGLNKVISYTPILAKAACAGFAGYQIGTYLFEQFDSVKSVSYQITGEILKFWEGVKLSATVVITQIQISLEELGIYSANFWKTSQDFATQ